MDPAAARKRKREIRKRVAQSLSGIGPEDAAARSATACERLAGLAEFGASEVVMAFLTIEGEVDTMPLIRRAWEAGKTVLLPKVRWEPREMFVVAWRSLDDPMVVGRYNIPEPACQEAWPVERIDLIVLPAMAYDPTGRRLGKGGGFYDRFLAQEGLRAVCCGLAFTEQVIDDVCDEPHDRPVDMLVTDRQVLRFDRPGGAGL